MEKETEKFYKTFCKMTQSKSGMWEQRFYTDGTLAPCWGYQIDETASVIYGVFNHYEHTKDLKFLKDTLKMCESATKYLKKYIQNLLEGKEEEYKSYDLWEENEGIHTYSLASIFASFEVMIKIYDKLKPEFATNRLKLEKIQKEKAILKKYLIQIKDYILKNLYDNKKKTFIRNRDGKTDISLLGLVTPFKVFVPKEKKILNTIERIDLNLRTYTGGYLRYETDRYVGGNPWVIANLWMANYYIEAGNKTKARECFDFVIKTATEHGFLGEQIENKTMQTKWVIGLGWSHAMFINVLQKLYVQ
ncbi:MAG: glycoside hydrolase family 15 protein [Clostridia bacterium]|nr:glycoside hydrolase family 15 protein [Clostridia bacterium]